MQASSKNILILSLTTASLVLDILSKIELRGSKNIIKAKLGRYLNSEVELIQRERQDLLLEHAILDVNGRPMVINAQYQLKDLDAWKKVVTALEEQSPIIIDGTTDTVHRAQIAFIREITSDELCPPISGQLGFAFEDLDTALTVALGTTP